VKKLFVNAFLKNDTERTLFLTGDLGFNALEPIRDALKGRFINTGIAEQNMVSVSAGLAKTGFSVWVYSIAPFCYARPFEQVRNDVCLHGLPVHLVGNGGGYGYGVMGATHHALEDYGVLLTLPNMRVYIPAFGSDLDYIIPRVQEQCCPSYLRLGKCEKPAGFVPPPYKPWRKLKEGDGLVLISVGAITGGIFGAVQDLLDVEVWAVTELPLKIEDIPDFGGRSIWVVEEHVAQGSFGQIIAAHILQKNMKITEFRHFCAKGYPTHTYGSQEFHRKESGIDCTYLREQLLDDITVEDYNAGVGWMPGYPKGYHRVSYSKDRS